MICEVLLPGCGVTPRWDVTIPTHGPEGPRPVTLRACLRCALEAELLGGTIQTPDKPDILSVARGIVNAGGMSHAR